MPRNQREFRDTLKRRFHHDLAAANQALGTPFASWDEVRLLEIAQLGETENDRLRACCVEFELARPRWQRVYRNADGAFIQHLRQKYVELDPLNQALGTDFRAWETIRLPSSPPSTCKVSRRSPRSCAW